MNTNSQHRFPGTIKNNYLKYLNEPQLIGFIESFPVKSIIDTITLTKECLGYEVTFSVKHAIVSFGKKETEVCHAIITDRVSISSKLPLNGFASNCCYDEAKTMELGIIEMCAKHDLMICTKINSWPFAKAIVQPNHFID